MKKALVLFAMAAALVCAADKKPAAKKVVPKPDAQKQDAAAQPAPVPVAAKPVADSNGQGGDMGNGVKACVPGDKMPAGSVVAGLKKVVNQSPFGDVCRWEPVKQADASTDRIAPASTDPAPAEVPPSTPAIQGKSSGNASSFGADMGSGVRACVPGDKSPAGSIVAGLKKVVSQTPFGEICRWEPAK